VVWRDGRALGSYAKRLAASTAAMDAAGGEGATAAASRVVRFADGASALGFCRRGSVYAPLCLVFSCVCVCVCFIFFIFFIF